MSWNILLVVLTPILTFSLVACSSGGGSVEPGAVAEPEMAPVQARVVLIENDTDGDGELDDTYEFAYDVDGRVTSVTFTDINAPVFNEVYAFTYDGNDLVTRMTSYETVIYSVENGRVVEVEEVQDETFRFTYNDAGQMTQVVGDAFFLDDDCLNVFTVDPEDEAPRYTLAYDSAGRFTGSQGSYGDVFSVTYLNNGRVGSISQSGECSRSAGTTAVFTYDNRGFAVLAVTTSPDGDRSEIRVTRESDRPVQLVMERTRSDGSMVQSSSTMSYNAEGLLESVSSVVVGDDVEEERSRVTYRYEAESCVEQVMANPIDRLLSEDLAAVNLYEAGLRCGYVLDVI